MPEPWVYPSLEGLLDGPFGHVAKEALERRAILEAAQEGEHRRVRELLCDVLKIRFGTVDPALPGVLIQLSYPTLRGLALDAMEASRVEDFHSGVAKALRAEGLEAT